MEHPPEVHAPFASQSPGVIVSLPGGTTVRKSPRGRTQSTAKPSPTAKPSAKVTAKPTAATVRHADCDAVRAAGKAPTCPTDPGFRKAFDRNGDSVGCDR